MPHRRGGGNQAGGRVGIKVGGDDGAALLLGPRQNGAGHRRAAADHNGPRAAVDGAHLGLIPVGHQHQVAGVQRAVHDFRAGADEDMPLRHAGVGVAFQHLALQRGENIAVAGARLGQHGGVEQVHVGVGDVLHRDEALQLVLAVGDAQRVDLHVPHQRPCGAHAHLLINARLAADVDVLDLGAEVGAKAGRLHPEMPQHKGGLPVDRTGAPRLVHGVPFLVFQVGIGQRRADGIRIGIFVADDVHFSSYNFVWHE